MKLDHVSSERLNLLRFPLIVGVVFLHAYAGNIETTTEISRSEGLSDLIQYLISKRITRISVPLFFLISGYLFFLNFEWSLDNYIRKLSRRVHSLLIPFLFWNSLTLLLLVIAESIPAVQIYFSGQNRQIYSFEVFDYFNALLGINRFPISYQFWFIRDLMIMVLLVPLLQLIFRTVPIPFLGLLGLLWFFLIWPIYMPSPAASLFFCLGAFFAFSGQNIFAFDRYGNIFISIYIAILVLLALTRENELNGYINRIGILFGMASALYISKLVLKIKTLKSFLLWTSGCSFFVFAVHEPTLGIFRKLSYKLITPNSDITILALYFIVPLAVISVSIMSYVTLKMIAPKFLSVISGGRSW